MNVNLQTPQKTKDKHERDTDTLLTTLKNKTPQQASDYIDTYVTDLASAKQVLKALAKVITYLLRNQE